MIICTPWTVTQFELKKLTKVAFITVSGALFTWGRRSSKVATLGYSRVCVRQRWL
jgi:hypothetical protein